MYSFKLKDIAYRDYTDYILIYNLKKKEIIVLKEVSADIWRLISESDFIDINKTAKDICESYDANIDEVLCDVNEFIKNLYQEGYLLKDGEYLINYNHSITNTNNSKEDIEGDIINDLRHKNQLYSVTFELTYKCNEKCIHCYAKDTSFEKENLLTLEMYKNIINDLYAMNCFHIAFTGGDPFLYGDFYELFQFARSKGFICDIYTNGQILSQKSTLLKKVAELNPRAIYISLYGSNAHIHDNITQIDNSFDNTIKSIKKLKEFGVSVVINIMVLKDNVNDIENIINLVDSMGCEYRIGLSIINTNDGNSSPMKYFVEDKEKIKKILELNNNNLTPYSKLNEDNIQICGAALSSLSISPNGIIYPCISVKKELGNIHTNNIKEIWLGKERKDFINSNIWSNTSECVNCSFLKICPHCIGISERECGDIFACNTCDRTIASVMYELLNE